MGNIGYETGGIDLSSFLFFGFFALVYLCVGFLKIKEWWNERKEEQIKWEQERILKERKKNQTVYKSMADIMPNYERYATEKRARPIMQTTTAGEPCHLTEQDYKRSK